MTSWFTDITQDVRHALRSLTRTPGFTAVAVVTLALGIAGSATVFGVLKKIAIEPLPYPDANRVMAVWVADTSGKSSVSKYPFSAWNYEALRTQNHSFAAIGCYGFNAFTVGGDMPEMLRGLECTASLGAVLGVKPAQGRWFNEADEQVGASPVAVISHRLWKSHFNADPGLVGRRVRVNDIDSTIIGIMPERIPIYSRWFFGDTGEIFQPLILDPQRRSDRSNRYVAMGRLKSGVTQQSAAMDLNALGVRLAKEDSRSDKLSTIQLQPLASEVYGPMSTALAIMEGAVLIVMLLACVNVAGMLLARSARRQTEIAVRTALGAGRLQIIRLLLTENVLLSGAACVVGLILTGWGFNALARFAPSEILSRGDLRIDGMVLAFTVVLTMTTMLLAGVLPAAMAARTNVAGAIKEGSGQQSGSRSRMKHYRLLIVTEVALTILLVNVALLLSDGYRKIVIDSQAIASGSTLTANINFTGPAYKKKEVLSAFQKRLLDTLKMEPGVTAVGLTNKLPFEGGNNTSILANDEVYNPKIPSRLAEISSVSPGFFDAVGVTLQQGRLLTDADAQAPVPKVVVNQMLARSCWPGQNPIGKIVRRGKDHLCVVGVVADARQHGIERATMPEIYVINTSQPKQSYVIVLRTNGDAHRLIPVLRQHLRQLDPDLALAYVRTMDEVFAERSRIQRFQMFVIDSFMLVALLLAAIGIYGILAFFVAVSMREIGIRMAMGASSRTIVKVVFGKVAPWLSLGAIIGIAITFAVCMMLRAAFYETHPLNPLYLAGAVLIVSIMAALACWLPIRRATRIHPMEALRAE